MSQKKTLIPFKDQPRNCGKPWAWKSSLGFHPMIFKAGYDFVAASQTKISTVTCVRPAKTLRWTVLHRETQQSANHSGHVFFT